MSDHLLPYLANCSLLFTEEPLLRRPAAARAAGFGAVEFWWPFAVPVPSDREVDAFTTAIEEAGVALAGLNFFVGIFNLLPLLPLDGGHIAIATFEKISSLIMRRKVQVDAAKLMPIAAAVLVLLLFIFVSSVFLDVTRPVANPF